MSSIVDDLRLHLGRKKPLRDGRVDFFARLAREAPVTRWGTFWVLADYRTVRAATVDPHLRMAKPDFPEQIRRENPDFVEFFSRSMSVGDRDDHKRLRQILMPQFSADALAGVRESVDEIVGNLLAPGIRDGRLDLVRQVAMSLPVLVTSRLLGLPRPDYGRVWRWADGLLAVLGDSFLDGDGTQTSAPLTADEFAEMRDYVLDAITARRRHPGTDLLARLTAAVTDGRCTPDELVDLVLLMFMTGVDTVTSAVTNAALCAVQHPHEWADVVRDPDRAHEFVAESLRLMTPVAFGAREVHGDTVVNGTELSDGDVVTLVFAAANLDADHFGDPLAFRPERRAAKLTFGHGTHYCIGSVLGALEAESVLQALARYDITLARPVTWRGDLAFNSPATLSLNVGGHRRSERSPVAVAS